MQRARLGHVLAAGQAHLEATGGHQGKVNNGNGHGGGKGGGKGGGHHRMQVIAQHLQLERQVYEYRLEYSPSEHARRRAWAMLKARYPELKQWSRLTKMVNEYLKGSYKKAKDHMYYNANREEHRKAMLYFYNKYLTSDLNKPLKKWPTLYERAMSDIYDTWVFPNGWE